MVKNHNKFSVYDCGLFLNSKWPHLGASPDGKVSCQCCSEWSDYVVKSLDFFKTCVLPEIMGKWYTKSRGSNSASPELASSNLPDSNLSFDGNVPSSSTNSNTPSTSGVSATSIASATTMKTYCYCNEPEDESRDMIGCDNSSCSIEWFHIDCLKIKSIPSGKWYCPDCQLLPKFKRARKQ